MVNIGGSYRNTYNYFKSIFIYFIFEDHPFMVQDNAKRKNMGQGI